MGDLSQQYPVVEALKAVYKLAGYDVDTIERGVSAKSLTEAMEKNDRYV